jgi:molybdenum cofactor cytidylyltransferase
VKPPELSVLIPAAGGSERLGQPKQLLLHHGRTLLQNAIELAEPLEPLEIIVVTGAAEESVSRCIANYAIQRVYNADWRAGMGTSIALGAASANPRCDGLMVLLCDQWQLTEGDLRTLADTWRSDPSRIVCANANGTKMPPAIFPFDCLPELAALENDRGARNVLEKHRDRVLAVPMENAGADLDTCEQLDQLEGITGQGRSER